MILPYWRVWPHENFEVEWPADLRVCASFICGINRRIWVYLVSKMVPHFAWKRSLLYYFSHLVNINWKCRVIEYTGWWSIFLLLVNELLEELLSPLLISVLYPCILLGNKTSEPCCNKFLSLFKRHFGSVWPWVRFLLLRRLLIIFTLFAVFIWKLIKINSFYLNI